MTPARSHPGGTSSDSMAVLATDGRAAGRSTLEPAAQRGRRVYRDLDASSVGLELGLSVTLGLGIGYWLDGELGTGPWMLALWTLLGLVAGFRGVLRAVRRADRAAEEEQRGAS